ncbi:HAMP domain-containing histidine kinase [Pendulispora rubella]|uniref:histidine kinase n=1 Tax=Pendulispora rubella TaxID=2741070 RepID=A0ABZ2KTJ2_9BACT
MSPFAAIALYPLWAVALAVGLVALRLGRSEGRGLVALCLSLAFWVTGLILLKTPQMEMVAERVLPFGMLLAGTYLHAGADVAGIRAPRILAVAYGYGIAVVLLGVLWPRLLYGPGAHGPGVLFLPLAAVSAAGATANIAWLAHLAAKAPAPRTRPIALVLGCATGTLGGGGVIGLRVLSLGDVDAAAPLLLVSVALAAYAVLRGEHGRARELVVQGAVYAVVTAALSALGLTVFYLALPHLAPERSHSVIWLIFVVFFAALPLEPLRNLIVEAIGRRLFRRPINIPELAEQVETSETRAEHAERLAEIGRLTSAVAHEIRNPLGVIAAQAKLLERGGASPALVASVRAQVDRAKRFLDDLLRYGKPRPLEVRDFDARAALHLAISHVRQAFPEAPPPIDVHAADAAASLEADRHAFMDVVTALVQNAAIAVSGRDGGKVTVSLEREPDVVRIVVRDNGPGVPQSLEERLFQPFVTGRGRDERHPGTGLGLAIAARWVERHGGTLVHQRPADGGACFVVTWPPSPR